MAADIIKFRNYSNGSLQELVVYDPSRDVLWTESSTQTLDLGIGINLYPVLHMTFPSRDLLNQFVEDLITALGTGGSGTVILTNLGPQASTTTTTTGPTTTTTTGPITTTTTIAGTTTTTTTLAVTTTTTNPTTTTTTAAPSPKSYTHSATSQSTESGACGVESLSQTGYTVPGTTISTLDGETLYTDSGLTTPFIGDGNFYSVFDGSNKFAIRINGSGVMSASYSCQ